MTRIRTMNNRRRNKAMRAAEQPFRMTWVRRQTGPTWADEGASIEKIATDIKAMMDIFASTAGVQTLP